MRKIPVILLMLIWLLFIFTACASPATSLVEYSNAVYDISIKYPQDWVKQENVAGAVVAFLSTKKGSDSFLENLNIIVQDYPMSLDSYTLLSLNQARVIIPNYTLIESLPTTLAGNPAFKVVYTGKQGENSLKWMQVWTIKNNKSYVVTYTAAVEQYQNYLGIIQEMIDSFIIF